MSRRASLLIAALFGWSAGANLFAQSPARPGGPSPTPSPSPQVSATPSAKSLVDSMDAADLKEAVQLLKSNYIKPEALNETGLDRATFEGILTRLGHGVVLLPDSAPEAAGPDNLFFGEILEGHIGYLRLGALTRPNLDALDTNLKTFATK